MGSIPVSSVLFLPRTPYTRQKMHYTRSESPLYGTTGPAGLWSMSGQILAPRGALSGQILADFGPKKIRLQTVLTGVLTCGVRDAICHDASREGAGK